VSPKVGLDKVLRAVAAALGRSGLRWYVFGAQAVLAYGLPRLTADLDITVAAQPGQVPNLVSSMEAAGLDLRVAGSEDFVRRTRVLPLIHRESGLPVDVVLAGPGLEEEFFAASREIDIAGVAVPVISPEDLLVTKILAGRPKDLDDVHGILRRHLATLDLDRCRRFLSLLEQALGRSDLLSELERALSRLR
jgi:hypothetical protein